MGAQGPQGMTGPEGPAGPRGPQGIPGESAVAPGEEATPPTVGFLRVEQLGGGGLDSTFEVVAFQAGIETTVNIGSQTGGGSSGRAEFSDFRVELLGDHANVAELFELLSDGTTGKLTFSLPDPAGGAPIPFLTSDVALVTRITPKTARNPNQSSVFEVAFTPGILTIAYGASSATHDATANTGSCTTTPCGCNGAMPTPIHFVSTQGGSLSVPATHVPTTYFSSSWSHIVNLGSSTGGGAGRTEFDAVEFVMPMNEEAICLFHKISRSTTLADGTMFETMSPLSAQFGPLYQHTHTLECEVRPEKLEFSSNSNGDIVAAAKIRAGAETHTTRTFDPTNGTVLDSRSRSWSRVLNNSSTSCQ